MNPKISLRGGGTFDILEPDYASLDMEKAAFGLAHINRFGGQAGTYSVAQHCVLLAQVFEWQPVSAFWALMHDLPEFALGDLVSPVKHGLGSVMDGYIALHTQHENAMAKVWPWLRDIDARGYELLVLGHDVLTADEQASLVNLDSLVETRIHPWSPAVAQRAWLTLFNSLKGQLSR